MVKKNKKDIFEDGDINKTHKIWWKFEKFLVSNFGEDWSKKLHGYDVIEKIKKYISNNKDIKIITCDDSVFATSNIIIVPHKNMGNTIIFLPQCSEQQNVLFLYPENKKNLIEILKKMED